MVNPIGMASKTPDVQNFDFLRNALMNFGQISVSYTEEALYFNAIFYTRVFNFIHYIHQYPPKHKLHF